MILYLAIPKTPFCLLYQNNNRHKIWKHIAENNRTGDLIKHNLLNKSFNRAIEQQTTAVMATISKIYKFIFYQY